MKQLDGPRKQKKETYTCGPTDENSFECGEPVCGCSGVTASLRFCRCVACSQAVWVVSEIENLYIIKYSYIRNIPTTIMALLRLGRESARSFFYHDIGTCHHDRASSFDRDHDLGEHVTRHMLSQTHPAPLRQYYFCEKSFLEAEHACCVVILGDHVHSSINRASCISSTTKYHNSPLSFQDPSSLPQENLGPTHHILRPS